MNRSTKNKKAIFSAFPNAKFSDAHQYL